VAAGSLAAVLQVPSARALSPCLAACCEIAMGVTMGYMLIVLIC